MLVEEWVFGIINGACKGETNFEGQKIRETLLKTRSRMTTAITFSRQNDAGSVTREHCLVLRKPRSHGRPRLRIQRPQMISETSLGST